MATAPKTKDSTPAPKGITKITVAGFKSIAEEQSIEIRPLTILAGANSSGKSSIMQPLLLLKQTLEASYDPGPLRLDGPNVRFTSAEQFLSRVGRVGYKDTFHVGIVLDNNASQTIFFHKPRKSGLEVQKTILTSGTRKLELRAHMSYDEIAAADPNTLSLVNQLYNKDDLTVIRDRFSLAIGARRSLRGMNYDYFIGTSLSNDVEHYVGKTIHLPGLRGNPERTYFVAAVGATFPGTFENYAASVLAKWQTDKDKSNLENLCQDLKELGLAWKVSAVPLNDTQVELRVARLPHATKSGTRDMVNIADVGFGVSQTLPVIVALHAAKSGQLVYLEQPEIHLHPRAQTAMAKVLADAARRGVRVVAETHSALLILGIQTLVAEGKLDPALVKLHWFERKGGTTKIKSADLDEAGSFGDWPEDFADVALEAQSNYLDAAESRMMEKRRAS